MPKLKDNFTNILNKLITDKNISEAEFRILCYLLMVDRKHRDFTGKDIQKLADTFTAFQDGTLEDVKGFCAIATTAEIAKQDYILTPGRYVGIEEEQQDDIPFEDKMKNLTSELSDLFEKSHILEYELREKLADIGFEIR